MANKWAFLNSNAFVRLLGVTLSSPFSLVLEYLRLGPLDAYLNANQQIIKLVDLVEAGAYLATALWHLVNYLFFISPIFIYLFLLI